MFLLAAGVKEAEESPKAEERPPRYIPPQTSRSGKKHRQPSIVDLRTQGALRQKTAPQIRSNYRSIKN